MSNEIDLNKPPPHHTYSVSIEPEETTGERSVRLLKEIVLLLVAVCFAGIIAFLCVKTLLSSAATAEEKKWAMSILTAAMGGIIGYLVRK